MPKVPKVSKSTKKKSKIRKSIGDYRKLSKRTQECQMYRIVPKTTEKNERKLLNTFMHLRVFSAVFQYFSPLLGTFDIFWYFSVLFTLLSPFRPFPVLSSAFRSFSVFRYFFILFDTFPYFKVYFQPLFPPWIKFYIHII